MIKIPVTVIVPVKNEELNLHNCLNRLIEFDQVIVIDSSSEDKTSEIISNFDFEFINFNWDGKFPKKRNWALRNLDIKNEWVFFLDADEYITPKFIEELKIKIQNANINGFWVKYQNYFMNKKLKFGDSMIKLPLFRVGKGEYEKIDEDLWSHLDMEVHEHPLISGKIEKFNNCIIHNDYKSLEHYIKRHNAYSSWEANRYFQLKKNKFKGLTKRQKIKYKLLDTGFLPMIYFLGSFIFKLGFLDGKEGFYLAKYKSNYFFQIYTKIIELKLSINQNRKI